MDLAYTSRPSAIEPGVTVRVGDEGLEVRRPKAGGTGRAEDALVERWSWASIARVRLGRRSVRGRAVHWCRVVSGQGVVEITTETASGASPADVRAYRDVVRALHAKLAGRDDVLFEVGSWVEAFGQLALSVFFGIAFAVVGWLRASWLLAVAGAVVLLAGVVTARTRWPSAYRPEAIPEDVLPKDVP